ncbi:hypothetical protein ACS0TY_023037 [Phlomoides rotata]
MECFTLLETSRDKKGIASSSQGLKTDCVYKYHPQQPHLCQVKPAASNETTTTNRYEVVQLLDGTSNLDRSQIKSVAIAC